MPGDGDPDAAATGQIPTPRQAEPDGEAILVASGLHYAYLDRYAALTDVSVTIRRVGVAVSGQEGGLRSASRRRR